MHRGTLTSVGDHLVKDTYWTLVEGTDSAHGHYCVKWQMCRSAAFCNILYTRISTDMFISLDDKSLCLALCWCCLEMESPIWSWPSRRRRLSAEGPFTAEHHRRTFRQ
ncbi:hypothetical protein FKM82_020573 [Ascaphus truei]